MFRFDIIGLGQPIVDVLIRLQDDAELASLGLERGSWQLVDLPRWSAIYDRFADRERILASGGSCANTMSFLGRAGGFGAPGVVFCGQRGNDEFGRLYGDYISYTGCTPHLITHPRLPTGRALSLVSPDGERTMVVHLGASEALGNFEDRVWQLFRQTRHAHFTAFMLAREPMRSVTLESIRLAKLHGATVSIDIAAPALIKEQRDILLRLVERCQVDVLFANTREMAALADAVILNQALRRLLDLHPGLCIVLKAGASGSLVLTKARRERIPVTHAEVVDTTGAGDAYAGAFLAGYCRGWSLRRCGLYASRVAALVVAKLGATLDSGLDALRVRPINDAGDTFFRDL